MDQEDVVMPEGTEEETQETPVEGEETAEMPAGDDEMTEGDVEAPATEEDEADEEVE